MEIRVAVNMFSIISQGTPLKQGKINLSMRTIVSNYWLQAGSVTGFVNYSVLQFLVLRACQDRVQSSKGFHMEVGVCAGVHYSSIH